MIEFVLHDATHDQVSSECIVNATMQLPGLCVLKKFSVFENEMKIIF